jgi:molybdenum cofactor cytidylyltransferase
MAGAGVLLACDQPTRGAFSTLILAAGSSSRLGRPKQLVPFGGTTLIEHAVQIAKEAGAREVIVVLGADADKVEPLLQGVLPVVNPRWEAGMGSSISCGMRSLSQDSKAVIITVCDQPKVTAEHLRKLANEILNSQASIAASSYAGVLGVPAAFGSSLFPELGALRGDKGARDLIRRTSDVAAVELVGGERDIDVPADVPG